MPSPLVNDPTIGWLHSGAQELQRQLRNGNGADWPGDDRLSLALRVVKHPIRTEILGRRYEVWRNMEDGRFEMIYHCRLDEFDRILPDLVLMRMDSPAWVSAEKRMDANNAAIEQTNADLYVERMFPMMEHLKGLREHHNPHESKTKFFLNEGKRPDAR